MSEQTTEPKRFDLSRYRTPELFERVFSLLDLAGTLRVWALCLLAIVALILAATWFLFSGVVAKGVLVGLMIYAGFAGLAVGNLICLCRAADTALDNVGGLVDITLDTVRVASEDFEKARGGDMPTAAELVRASYRDVTLPVLEKILAEKIWIVGKPLLWIYRRTLGRLIDFAIEKIPVEVLAKDGGEEELKQHVQRAETLHNNRESIERYATRIGEISGKAQRGIRKWAMRPLWVIAAFVGLTLLVPLVVAYLLAV